MGECGTYIGQSAVSYPCTLERGHAGPCYAVENAKSVRERSAWEETQRNLASGLSQFQGPALTTAQSYTEGATTTPETPEQRQERLDKDQERRQGMESHPTAPHEPARPQEAPVPLSEVKNRPEDQPLPVVNDRPFIQDLVIADLEARKALGIRRYHTALQPFNGRDALRDAYEEALDLVVYLKQVMVERDG